MRGSWVLFGILGIFTVCSGFSLDRSVPVGWEQAAPFGKNWNGKTEVTGMEKIIQASVPTKSLEPEGETPEDQFREKRSEQMTSENSTNQKSKKLEEFKDDIHFPIEENSSIFPKESEIEKPRNAVLMFIDESGQDHQELWKGLQTSNNFPVHGFLQSCRNEELGFPLDESLIFGKKYHCECEHFLRANMASLLSWAQRAKEMTTGAVSATNFSIPSALGYESSIFRHNYEESEENKMKMLKPQVHDEWHLIDVDKEGICTVSPSVFSTPKQEGEQMWDVFNTFSKIRVAFFRNLLESFHKNAINTEDKFSTKKTTLESSLVELIRDTVEKLKSISNDKGFIMVAVAPGNKISPAIEILQTEISPKDTLLVVSGMCSQDRKLVPFFANGPGSKYMYEAKTVWDLVSAVRRVVSGCQGLWCKVETLDPIWAPDHEFHRRFAREKLSEKVDPSLTTVIQKITETAKVSGSSIVNTKNSTVNHSQHNINETSPESLAEKLTEESDEKSTEESVENSTEKSTEKSIGKPTEKSTENLNDELMKKSAEILTEKLTEESPEKSTEKSPEESTEKSTEKLNEKSIEKSAEKLTEKLTQKPTEKSTEKSTEESIEKSKEATTRKSSIKPGEKLKENPKENTTGSSSENPHIEIHNFDKNPKSENTSNVEVEQIILSHSRASGFSMETTAIIGAVTSWAATIFLDFYPPVLQFYSCDLSARLFEGIACQILGIASVVIYSKPHTIKMLLIHPTEEMSKQIRVELNENVETRDKDVETIKEWLKKQPHLPEFDDDYRIMTFLRGCKFSLEKCKRKLDMYFTMRALVPEFFANRDITRSEMKEICSIVQVPPLPGLTKNGRRVVLMRGIDKNLPSPNVAEAMKLVLMIGDVRLKDEIVGVAGDVYILDASVATPTHYAKFTPALVKKFLVCVQEAYPVKLKEVHVINVSPLVDTIINFVKPFLKEKIRNRIFVHSTMETLYEHIHQDMLPSEYGGKAGPIQAIHDSWINKLEEYGPWFKEQESVKANEALRPGKPKTHDSFFGLDGSFRQLSID
ncbi:uncharacterized protein LOC117173723 [Belonocnema kinseyi]|uniref:uncharacterized protein LOC117173723 n=1 Tax=Belonocnema kinseyi TaxID=2817044 RepID=UPI00143D650E|nr:uncharacterized protein LOC117173723 [Belonocnema kinseyi]